MVTPSTEPANRPSGPRAPVQLQAASWASEYPFTSQWLDVGTGETRMLKGARLLHRMLLRKGWQAGVNLEYHEAEGALHDERAWGQRSGLFLQFLFPFK